jgi:hypothetical protein
MLLAKAWGMAGSLVALSVFSAFSCPFGVTLKDGRANWVYVETAQENSDSYVVTDGLHAGDSRNINLAHETPVELRTKSCAKRSGRKQ